MWAADAQGPLLDATRPRLPVVHPGGGRGEFRGSQLQPLTTSTLILARQMFKDPTWLGKYWEYVEKFHLQRAPVFNMDGKCCLPALPRAGQEKGWGPVFLTWKPLATIATRSAQPTWPVPRYVTYGQTCARCFTCQSSCVPMGYSDKGTCCLHSIPRCGKEGWHREEGNWE